MFRFLSCYESESVSSNSVLVDDIKPLLYDFPKYLWTNTKKAGMNEEFHAAFEDAITSYVFIYPFLKESLRVRDISLAY